MPLRQRLKRAFTRSNLRAEAGSSSSEASSKYDAPMPPMKYRRPVDPAHRERLFAFNFATAWRRGSAFSHRTIDLSPGGSRIPSRRNSSAPRRKSLQTRRDDSAVEKISETSSDDLDLSSIGIALTSPYGIPTQPAYQAQSTYELERPKTAPSHRHREASPIFSQEELNRAFMMR